MALLFENESSEAEKLISFRPVSTDDISLLRHYFANLSSRSCDFSIGGVLLWKEYFKYEIAEFESSLFIKGFDPVGNSVIFHIPCGDIEFERFISIVKNWCERNNINNAVVILPETNSSDEYEADKTANSSYLLGWMEYLYDANRFVAYSGKKMEKKRNHFNYFVNNFSPYSVEEICEHNIPDLLAFTVDFADNRNGDDLADYECNQVLDALRNFSLYGYEGIAIRIEGKIVGYSFGEIAYDTFVIHVEKADTNYRGSYQAVASALARFAIEKYQCKYLNREDDMGVQSLRRSKLSYHPSLFINKRIVKI